MITVLDYNRWLVNHTASAESLAKHCLMKLSYVLLFLYITDFLLLLFYTFPQTQTFNSKQQQHHITVKKNNQNQNQQKMTTKPTNQTKTHTKKKHQAGSVQFSLLSLFFCYFYTFIPLHTQQWCTYFKYRSMKQTIKSQRMNAITYPWFMSWNTTFCYNFPPSTRTAPGGRFCFKSPCCRGQGRTAGKKFF